MTTPVAGSMVMGQVAIWLRFQTDQADKDMEDAQRRVDNFSRGAKTSLLAISAAATFLGYKVREMVRDFGEAGGELNRMSRETNTSVQWLQKMNYVVGLTGHSVNTLEGALKTMNASLHSAQFDAGSGASMALKALNLNVRELYQLSSGQRFQTIVARLMNIENAARRAGLAAAIFGDGATDMMAAFSDEGGRTMAEYVRQAELFGTIMTGPMLTSARQVEQSTFRMNESFKGLSNTIGYLVAPYLLLVERYITAMVLAVRKVLEANPQFVSSLMKVATTMAIILGVTAAVVATFLGFTTGIIPVLVLVAVIAGLLDVLGLVDTGFESFFSNIRIGTNSVMGWWENMTAYLGDRLFFVWEVLVAMMTDWYTYLESAWLMWGAIGAKMLEVFGMDPGVSSKELLQAAKDKFNSIGGMAEAKENLAEGDWLRNEAKDEDRKRIAGSDIIGQLVDQFKNMFGQLGDVQIPSLGSSSAPSPVGVSRTYGVHGFLGGGSSLNEQLGAGFSAKTFEDRSIELQSAMKDSLSRIEDNTRQTVDPTL